MRASHSSTLYDQKGTQINQDSSEWDPDAQQGGGAPEQSTQFIAHNLL